ncbi:LysM domain-containing protein [Dehalobacter sp. DCM]|uniref:LysM peptidoglycan-binding domain-containing protein n=1 Tax=Dehalobacter sp. DCM TaxID=2907827 RepID=UPI003081861B|nr:LysM domain-containing protein [Dehalobacter sp. DCM]
MTCPKGTIPYHIKQGDTFYTLARRFNTTVQAIASVNIGVDANNLIPGSTICIPIRRSVVPCPPENRYVIKAGDTFSKLAARYRISAASILSLNSGVDPTNLQVGQIICLPIRRRRKS